MSNKQLREAVMDILENYADFTGTGLKEATSEILTTVIKAIKDEMDKLPSDTKFSYVGCARHWADDYSVDCTCDQNTATATQYYKEAIKDIQSILEEMGDNK